MILNYVDYWILCQIPSIDQIFGTSLVFGNAWSSKAVSCRSYGDHKHCRKVLLKAISSVTDWPESVCEAYLNFEREEGEVNWACKTISFLIATSIKISCKLPVSETLCSEVVCCQVIWRITSLLWNCAMHRWRKWPTDERRWGAWLVEVHLFKCGRVVCKLTSKLFCDHFRTNFL